MAGRGWAGWPGAVTPCPLQQVNVEDTVEMLPKSRRALTIQEIAALARSSLHGNGPPGPGPGAAWGASEEGGGGVFCGQGGWASWGSPLWGWGGSRYPWGLWWHPKEGHGGASSQGLEAGGAGSQGHGLWGGHSECLGGADAGARLAGISQVVKEHVTKPTAMAQGRVAHLIEWKGWCKPVEPPAALESAFSSYCHLSEGEQEARFAAGGHHAGHGQRARSPTAARAGVVGRVVPIPPLVPRHHGHRGTRAGGFWGHLPVHA